MCERDRERKGGYVSGFIVRQSMEDAGQASRGEHISPRVNRLTEGFCTKRNSRTRCTASWSAIVEIDGASSRKRVAAAE